MASDSLRPPSAAQLKAFDILQREAKEYERGAKDFRDNLTMIVRHHYEERRRRILNALDSEIAVESVLETGQVLRGQVDLLLETDAGWVNRAWNDTTNTVVSGKALMQIHGDWMKGVWKGLGKEVGKDFGCINIPGTKAVSVTVDSFGILGGVAPDVLKAEEDFAATVVDPAVNAEFAFHKGSSPVRTDVPTDKLDACNVLVLDDLKKPGASVENPFYIADSDWINSVWNVMFTYQGDKNMTTDQVIEKLKSEYNAIFG